MSYIFKRYHPSQTIFYSDSILAFKEHQLVARSTSPEYYFTKI